MRSITYYSSFQHNRAKPIPRIPRRGRWLWYGLLGLFAAGFLFGCTLQSKNLFENSLLQLFCQKLYSVSTSSALKHVLLSTLGLGGAYLFWVFVSAFSCFGPPLIGTGQFFSACGFGYIATKTVSLGLVHGVLVYMLCMALSQFVMAMSMLLISKKCILFSFKMCKLAFFEERGDAKLPIAQVLYSIAGSSVMLLVSFCLKVVCFFIFGPYLL